MHRDRLNITTGPLTFALAGLIALVGAPTDGLATEVAADVGFGATAGVGGQVGLVFEKFTRDAPLSLRLSAAYSKRQPGDAMDARAVFINDNTNGTPEESGKAWQVRLDLMHPLTTLGRAPVNVGVGLRRASFTGTFDYVGGNEKFDVNNSAWGVGLVLDAAFAVTDRTDFALQGGFDHYFDATLEGHDTSYSPDGDDANPRDGYDFAAADEAINQPSLEFFGLVGFRIGLGR